MSITIDSKADLILKASDKFIATKELAPKVIFAIFPVKHYFDEKGVSNTDLELLEYVNLKSISEELRYKVQKDLKLGKNADQK